MSALPLPGARVRCLAQLPPALRQVRLTRGLLRLAHERVEWRRVAPLLMVPMSSVGAISGARSAGTPQLGEFERAKVLQNGRGCSRDDGGDRNYGVGQDLLPVLLLESAEQRRRQWRRQRWWSWRRTRRWSWWRRTSVGAGNRCDARRGRACDRRDRGADPARSLSAPTRQGLILASGAAR
jgi:hypothetical protein